MPRLPQPREERQPMAFDDDEYVSLKRTTVGRFVVILIATALLLLFSAFYSALVVEERPSITVICLCAGQIVMFIAMFITIIARLNPLEGTSIRAESDNRQRTMTAAEAVRLEARALHTEILAIFRGLREVEAQRRGSFGPRIACTIVKGDVAKPGFFVPASVPSCVEVNNPDYGNSPPNWTARRFPVPTGAKSPPAGTGPYHAYLDDGTDEIFYDAQNHPPQPSPTDAAKKQPEAEQEPAVKQRAMGQTKPRPTHLKLSHTIPVLPSRVVPVEASVTLEQPPPESHKPNTPEIGQDVPDCEMRLKRDVPHCLPPLGDIPRCYDYLLCKVDQLKEHIYEDPDQLTPRNGSPELDKPQHEADKPQDEADKPQDEADKPQDEADKPEKMSN